MTNSNKPEVFAMHFSTELYDKCVEFANNSISLSEDQYARRGQDINKRDLIINQLINGKLGEELVSECYSDYYNHLTQPDYFIYDKSEKNWDEDLVDKNANVRIAVKTKDRNDANRWGASWIFEKTDKKIFAPNIDPNQYVCLVVVDRDLLQGRMLACVQLQWLHDNNMFEKPDRDYLTTKLTVRYNTMLAKISSKEDLWQLKIKT